MVELLAVRARRRESLDVFQAARAGPLFVSALHASEPPSPDQVRRVVATTLRRVGSRGRAAQTAGEFGDHPDTAAARMTWALATIRTVSPTTAARPLRRLALAS